MHCTNGGSDATVLSWIAEHQPAYYRCISRSSLIETRADEEIFWVCSGRPSFFNTVVETRTTPRRLDNLMDEAIGFFSDRGIRTFAWRVEANDRPFDLRERLIERGFRQLEVGPTMTLDLAMLEGRLPARNLDIREVEGASAAADWAEVVVRSFGFSEGMSDFHAAWLVTLADESALRSFVGYQAGISVVSAQAFRQNDAVALYWVATRPRVRRRGLGTAITHAVLDDAKRTGARRALLDANGPAAAMYERIGFQPRGTAVRYLWTADASDL